MSALLDLAAKSQVADPPLTAPLSRSAEMPAPNVSPLTAHRVLSVLAVLSLLGPALKAWSIVVAVPANGLAIVALTGAGLALVCALCCARSETELARLDRWALVLGVLVLLGWAASLLHQVSGYSTDEAAFLQRAATRLLHGHDPYGASLAGSLSAYGVPPAFWTYTTAGGAVSTLGYPALPVLIVAPIVALTGGGQAVPYACFLMLALAAVVLHRSLPSSLRPLALLACIGLPQLLDFSLAGMTEVMMLAALIAAAHRWSEIGEAGRLARRGVLSAIAFGLALATNQLAWVLAPFLLTGIFCAARRQHPVDRAVRLVIRYLAVAAAVFLVVNLPFLIWHPGAWLRGIADPLLQHALPYGQGLVGVTLFGGLGGGAVGLFSIAGGLLLLALLTLFGREFERLHRALFVLPLLALFISGRSLAGYWVILVPVVLAGVLGGELPLPRRGARAPSRRPAARRVVTIAMFAPAAACLAISLTTPPPLSLTVLSAHSSEQIHALTRLTVAVVNRTGHRLTPHYATNGKGQMSAFWTVARGPRTLAAHASAVLTLTMADVSSLPPNQSTFLVQAVTDSPETISTSNRFIGGGIASPTG